jgi:hypothetical protein
MIADGSTAMIRKHLALPLALATALALTGGAAALPRTAPMPTEGVVRPAQLSGILDLFADDDDYVHDRHYDWEQYRNSTSRKERIRDYYRMQKEAEKDYWRAQKQMQKDMIKRQRGW